MRVLNTGPNVLSLTSAEKKKAVLVVVAATGNYVLTAICFDMSISCC